MFSRNGVAKRFKKDVKSDSEMKCFLEGIKEDANIKQQQQTLTIKITIIIKNDKYLRK